MRAIQLTPDTEEMIAEAMEYTPAIMDSMKDRLGENPFVLVREFKGEPLFAVVEENYFNETYKFTGEESANEFVEVEAKK